MKTVLRAAFVAPVTALLLMSLGACSKGEKAAATQVAARVNGSEISVHQINFILQRSNVKPEQAKSASEQILTRLVDQDLTVQKAVDRKLDRNPEVVQQIEAAKREILSRAYLESVASAAVKPTDKEIADYFAAHPELFSARRIYTYRVLGIQAPADKVAVIQDMHAKGRSLEDIAQWAKGENLRMVGDGGTKTAEQMPMQSLPRLSQMKDGQVIIATGPAGAELVHLIQSRTEPVTLEQSKPIIERFLTTSRRSELVQKEMKLLRSAAKIEFKGDFAHMADSLQSAPVALPDASAPADASVGTK
ncbi:EpsD family peptidyl-prolyl cis-trans isomerase [Viridibacterium curvum]|uniref:PpiC domain-containing protein n=1 Tax=Viridibacterium curvum TaxID=1101404 RepID=A0ABP9QZX5_9RHOO